MNRLAILFIFFLAVSLPSVAAVAQDGAIHPDKKNATSAKIEIDNFGKVNDRYYRPSQPEESDYAQLVTMGVKAIIDLRHRPDDRVKRRPSARVCAISMCQCMSADTRRLNWRRAFWRWSTIRRIGRSMFTATVVATGLA